MRLKYKILLVLGGITMVMFATTKYPLLGIVLLALLFVFLQQKFKRGWVPTDKVIKRIEAFTPSRNYASEEGYQGELQGWLKSEFPKAKVENRTGSSRPDIAIGDIAIEVKGPTDDSAIDSLGTKCLKYTQYYNQLVFVLFDKRYSEDNFAEVMKGIKRHFPNVRVIVK